MDVIILVLASVGDLNHLEHVLYAYSPGRLQRFNIPNNSVVTVSSGYDDVLAKENVHMTADTMTSIIYTARVVDTFSHEPDTPEPHRLFWSNFYDKQIFSKQARVNDMFSDKDNIVKVFTTYHDNVPDHDDDAIYM